MDTLQTTSPAHELTEALVFDYRRFWTTTRAYETYKPAKGRAGLTTRKVYGYVRQSLDAFGDNLASDRQEAMIREHVPVLSAQEVAAGRLPLELVDVIRDNNVSASGRKKRPGWARLWQMVEDGEAHGIVAYHPDRMYRVLYDLEDLINLAERTDLFLATCSTSELDLRTPEGKVQARLLGSFARYEMERKSARQRIMHNQRALLGTPWAPTRSFGYEIVKDDNNKVKTLAFYEPEASAMREAYDRLLNGESLGSICRWLNEAGLFTTRGSVVGRKPGGPWITGTLARTMKNPVYAGLRVRNTIDPNTGKPTKAPELFAGNWPALIDPEKHAKVIALLEGRDVAGTKSTAKHLLSRLLQCGVCVREGRDGVLVGKRNGTYLHYRCITCGKVGRNAAAMDEWVIRLVESRLAELRERGGVIGKDEGQALADLEIKLTAMRERTRVLVARQTDEDTKMDDEDWDITYQGRRRAQRELEAQMDAMRTLSQGGVDGDVAAVWEFAETLSDRRAVIRQLCPVLVVLHSAGTGRIRKGQPRIVDDLILTSREAVEAWKMTA